MARDGDAIETKTTCPYCGVGCGVTAIVDAQENVSVAGDETHPANFGKLCSKGSALAETLGLHNRLLYPQMDGKSATWDAALDRIANTFSDVIAEHGPDAVAFYVSGQLLTEDYYVANKFMKGYIGSGNIDTNSRLCMASSVVGHKRAFGADIVPGSYEDLELADLLILTGSNLAWCHPILYQRIMAAKALRPEMKIVVIDPRETASCDLADLHLPLAPGSDVALFQGLFKFLDENGFSDSEFVKSYTEDYAKVQKTAQSHDLAFTAKATGVSRDLLQSFYNLFAFTPKTVTVYSQGVNQAKDGTDKVNTIINCHLLTGRIGKPGAGPFSVTGQPNAMGGREVGGLSNQLASHMDIENPKHRDLVKRFWNAPALADTPGLKAVDLFEAMHDGKIKAVWIMATNPVDSMPNADRVKAALGKCDLVIVSDIYADTDTVACADIVLPSTGWGEKDGTVTNSERRISRQRAFQNPPGQTRHDWQQFCDVAKRMGFDTGFDFENPADIFKEYAGLCAFENWGSRDLDLAGLAGLTEDEYETLTPVQWPVNTANPNGLERFFEAGRYYTKSKKANFVAPAKAAQPAKSGKYPLILNTGRIRDQWHTMTRTGRSVRLSQHICEPFAEFHPDDAAPLGLENADIAVLENQFGKMHARVKVTPAQRRGSVFAPMHFTDGFASLGRADALTHSVVDPISGQPALKSTPCRASKLDMKWYGFAVLAADIFEDFTPPEAVCYWAKARINSGLRIEMAGLEELDNPLELFKALTGNPDGADFLDMISPGGGQSRFACLNAGRVAALLYLDISPVAVSREWACSQLGSAPAGAQRHRLLAGRPGADMPDKGAIICSCMNVGVNDIRSAVRAGCASVDAVGEATTAGTNCGSCMPEIRNILKEMQLVIA